MPRRQPEFTLSELISLADEVYRERFENTVETAAVSSLFEAPVLALHQESGITLYLPPDQKVLIDQGKVCALYTGFRSQGDDIGGGADIKLLVLFRDGDPLTPEMVLASRRPRHAAPVALELPQVTALAPKAPSPNLFRMADNAATILIDGKSAEATFALSLSGSGQPVMYLTIEDEDDDSEFVLDDQVVTLGSDGAVVVSAALLTEDDDEPAEPQQVKLVFEGLNPAPKLPHA